MWVGLVASHRPDAARASRDAIARCRRAGIRTVILHRRSCADGGRGRRASSGSARRRAPVIVDAVRARRSLRPARHARASCVRDGRRVRARLAGRQVPDRARAPGRRRDRGDDRRRHQRRRRAAGRRHRRGHGRPRHRRRARRRRRRPGRRRLRRHGRRDRAGPDHPRNIGQERCGSCSPPTSARSSSRWARWRWAARGRCRRSSSCGSTCCPTSPPRSRWRWSRPSPT